MTEPDRLEELLRAALRQDALRVPEDGARGVDHARVRANVLGAVRARRARRRRLGAGAGAVALLLSLALGVLQVLGGSASTGLRTGTTPRSELSGQASCVLGSRTVRSCGRLATGTAAVALRNAAGDAARAAGAAATFSSVAPVPAPPRFGRTLVVRAGDRVVVALPVTSRTWRWTVPSVAGASVSHGPHPVVVRATPPRTGVERFVVQVRTPVTVILVSAARVRGARVGSAAATGHVATWALELEVKAT